MPEELQTMSLSARFDESGTDASSPNIVMAGHLADFSQWQALERDWKQFLSDHGAPYFHGVEIRNRRGHFGDWDRSKAQAFLKDAKTIVRARVECSIAIAMRKVDYHEALAEIARQNVRHFQPASEYGFCFRHAMTLACTYVSHLYPGEQISFCLADGAANAGDAERIFRINKYGQNPVSKLRPFLSDCAFEHDSPSLQAADYWCDRTLAQLKRGRFRTRARRPSQRMDVYLTARYFEKDYLPWIFAEREKRRRYAAGRLAKAKVK